MMPLGSAEERRQENLRLIRKLKLVEKQVLKLTMNCETNSRVKAGVVRAARLEARITVSEDGRDPEADRGA